ncbi:phosphatase PAP2 family protein [Nesterenkonia salmonea]|uniref:phosphatase PAP2 family protein n=1 Tax=Nesterenkonia salmonea TaxID=1804987 RepID=UPI00140CE228|nr:phosphatase PAP2 family protein [Nesterenkonia salmonea]
MTKPLPWNFISAATYFLAAVACYIAFVLLQLGQQIDAAALGANFLHMPVELQLRIFGVLRTGSIAVFSVIAVVLGVVALIRGQWRLVMVTFLCSVLAAGGATLLRRVLWRPELGVESYDYNTWPSGHVAALCVLVLVCLRLVPQKNRWRWPVAVMAVVTVTAASYASMATFAHRPSDTFGGILIAGAVFALTRPRRKTSYAVRWGLLVASVAGAASLVMLVFPNVFIPGDPRAALAVGALFGMFAAACWVLLPESAPGYDKSSRN